MSLFIGGRSFFVPGIYAIVRVIQRGGSAIPAFNVGLIISKQQTGIPYTAGIGANKVPASQFILPFADTQSFTEHGGPEGDNEGIVPFRYAKANGAGTVYTLNVNPLTKATGGVIQNNEGSPVDALTISSVGYGAPVNDISITIATSVHTIIPPKNTTLLDADSGTDDTVTVKNKNHPFRVGDTVLIVDNVYAAPEELTIESIDREAGTITFTDNISASATTANYARLFQEDTDNQEVSGTLDTPAKVLDFYNASQYLRAEIAEGVTAMPTTFAKEYIQNLTSATKATSPEAQASDWQAIVDNFEGWNEEFAVANGIYLRVILPVTSDAANHASFRDLGAQMRSANKPIFVIAGADTGDYALDTSEANHPTSRATLLNSSDVQLAGIGLDGHPAYQSLAAVLFGITLSSEINHNLTRDLILANTVEDSFFERSPDAEMYTQAGVIVPIQKPTGRHINQGLTTYQDQSTTFNPSTKQTYLSMLRHLSDFDLRVMMELLDAQVGADGVTKEVLSGVVQQASDNLMNNLGYIKNYRIVRIFKQGVAFHIEREVALDTPTDFIGLTNVIVLEN